MTLNDRLVSLIHGMLAVTAHNKLMCITDREIAMSMMYMKDVDRNYIFSLLSSVKNKRIREELLLHERLNIRYNQYCQAIKHVIDIITSSGNTGSLRSYLRPRKEY